MALLLEYQGTRYAGFQVQRGRPTVQGAVQEALARLTGERIRIAGASRTDAGAHAKGQVVSFATRFGHPVLTFVTGLNYFLPEDIRVLAAQDMLWSFHARRSARSREYRYVVLEQRSPTALLRHLAYQAPGPFDLDKMEAAAALLVGERDFAPFAGPLEGARKSAVRTVYRFRVRRQGRFLFFTVEGNAFLPQQIRRMVGTLLEVGQSAMTLREFRKRAVGRKPASAGPCAPAHGLYLMRVTYSNVSLQAE
ncbi:MAG: tRNA pseudouridine(38-40) synthase TruA [Chloroflexi bacterium]|nr:tRNA pseudouridine(38-40) synthase TruA [Chloroflexota bacterium]